MLEAERLIYISPLPYGPPLYKRTMCTYIFIYRIQSIKSIFIHIVEFDPVGPHPLRSKPFVLFATVSQYMTAVSKSVKIH